MRDFWKALLISAISSSILLLSSTPPSAQWKDLGSPRVTKIGTGPQPSFRPNIVYRAYFLTSKEGWAVGYPGGIAHTVDGGINWEHQDSGTEKQLNDVFFISSKRGWAVGKAGVIIHTTDGGESWKKQESGTSQTLSGVYFVTPLSGWTVGSAGTIIHTSNGGRNWKQQRSGTRATLNDVFFINSRKGWVIGSSGTILHTIDGGRSWEPQASGTKYRLYDIFFTDPEEGWVVGHNGTILHAVDGGRSWEPQVSGTKNRLYDIFFIDPKEGWAVGSRGTILHTEDGGMSWELETGATDVQDTDKLELKMVFFVSSSEGLVIGRKGRVLRFSDVTDLEIPGNLIAREVYVIGGGLIKQHPWHLVGTFFELDNQTEPGWIQPKKISAYENLALTALERGGRVWTTWSEGPFSAAEGQSVIDTNSVSGYVLSTKETDLSRSGTIFLDLGAPFQVDKVRIRPVMHFETDPALHERKEEEEFYVLQRVEIGVNDGNPANVDGLGNPILTPVWGGMIDSDVTFEGLWIDELGGGHIRSLPGLEVVFPLQIARYVGINVINADVFSLSEIEVFGKDNFVPKASYVSDVIDFGDAASFGEIRWSGIKDPDAEVLIRTRSGSDEDPDVYWRWIGLGRSRRETFLSDSDEPLTREEYEALDEDDRGAITPDTENWSFWSAPYDFESGMSGLPIVSPEPCQFLQIKVDFINTPTDAGRVDFISFDFSVPPAAREIFAEISPIEVEPAKIVTFIYTLKPTIFKEDRGFDSLEITTPARIEKIISVRIDGEDVPFTWEILEDPTRLVVHFRRLGLKDSWGLLEVIFDSVVLRYGTEFVGRVYDSESDQVVQTVVPGDVRIDFDGDDVTVMTSLDTPLIESVEVSPNPFTPNGDGVNDIVNVSYTVLKLTDLAPVFVEIYDLSGAFVRTVYSGMDKSGVYSRPWDGKDDRGELVSPGVYIYRISVRADAVLDVRVGTVAVAY